MSLLCARTILVQLVAPVLDIGHQSVESFTLFKSTIWRDVTRRDGRLSRSRLPLGPKRPEPDSTTLGALHDQAWLLSERCPALADTLGTVRVVDLFAGCGGLTLGIAEACRALQLEMQAVMANDIDPQVLGIYGLNFPEARLVSDPVEELLDAEVGSPLSRKEKDLKKELGEIDLVIGGPPCQGHSDLNNKTRRDDPKNELYLKMARFCEVVRPTHVVIENVPAVVRDRSQVAQRTWKVLRGLGYRVDSGILNGLSVGVAQRRKRSLTIASLEVDPSVEAATREIATEERDLRWAIDDLTDFEPTGIFDTSPKPNDTNQDRIDYLHHHDLFELPDTERPLCHQKPHSYKSVYGRLNWDDPAQTITTGFGCTGRGRYVHPSKHRTITPHEAARIQFFPDFFDFGGDSPRTLLQKVIGNAVPPKMGYALGLHLLR